MLHLEVRFKLRAIWALEDHSMIQSATPIPFEWSRHDDKAAKCGNVEQIMNCQNSVAHEQLYRYLRRPQRVVSTHWLVARKRTFGEG